jgi:hypothetical protein
MSRNFLILLCLLCLAALGFGQINAPRVGLVRYSDLTVRPVYGLPASFVVGQPVAAGITAAAFSDNGGVLVSDGRIRVISPDGSTLAEEIGSPDAIVGIDNSLASAVAFLPASNTLLHFEGKEFRRTEISGSLPGSVLSLRANAETASLLIENERAVSEIRIALSSGSILSENFLSGVQAPAAYLGNFVAFRDERGLEIQAPNGTPQALPLACPSEISYERMAGNWLHITCAASAQQWALQASPKRFHLSELPLPLKGPRP